MLPSGFLFLYEQKNPNTMSVAQLDTKTTFLAPYEDYEGGLELGAARQAAMAKLEELDFPTTRHEEWKYFNLRPLLKEQFAFAPKASSLAEADRQAWFSDAEVNLLTFVNGYFVPEYSNIRESDDKITLQPLREAWEAKNGVLEAHLNQYTAVNENIFTPLNTAFVQDGLCLHLPTSAELAHPVVIHHIIDARAGKVVIQPRNLIVAEANARAKVLEQVTTLGEQSSFTNAVTEVVVARDARVDFHKVQEDSANAYQINQTFVEQDDNSQFADNTFSLSGAMVRNNLYIGLSEHNEAYMNGFFLLDGKTVVDNHTAVDHRKPHSMSDELYKGVLDERSTGIFNGKIFVRQDAQKTNAFQSNDNMLLSDKATIDTKPQLEIWADDVRCTHGATTGALDPEQLFYMQARGIPERKARGLLLKAFVGQVLDRITLDFLREYLEKRIEERLG